MMPGMEGMDWNDMANLSHGLGTMAAGDDRVKKLQELAWGLQTMSNKPGGKLPEDYKRECYRLSSSAISLCSNATYMEESDFLERAAEFTKKIEAKKIEVGHKEEEVKQSYQGRCLVRTAEGAYTVGNRTDSYAGGDIGGAVLGQATPQKLKEPPQTSLQKLWSKSGSDVIIEEVAPAMLASSRGNAGYDNSASGPAITSSEVAARCQDDPEALWLCDLNLGDGDMEAVCQGLRRGGSRTTSLDISHNRIGDAGIQRLATELAKGSCPKLAELWVGGNSFSQLGAQMLTGGVKAMRKSLSIHLSDGGGDTAATPTAASPSPVLTGTSPSASSTASCPEAAAPSATEAANHEVNAAPATAASRAEDEAAVDVADGVPSAAAQPSNVSVSLQPAAEGEVPTVKVAVASLPERVSGPQDLDLDVCRQRFIVRVAADGEVLADAAFPKEVDPDSAQAAFSRKRRTITLTLHTVERHHL
eukprot:TRINITY_DN23480_c0_g3_i1.p1 TRINITY_DN23480_c0_g3~~TRINITY_DN23480_c0_g3_i1.p1  ORF type:complete len:474 (-),score=111.84 TRINITY_DN23480_c0_g3_i1:245-1666(-)